MAVTITRTPWIDDDGTGTTGTVLNNAVKTELYGQIDEALAKVPESGAAITAPLGITSGKGTTTIPHNTATTIFALPAGKHGRWEIWATFGHGPGAVNYAAMARILNDGGTTPRIVADNSANLTLTLSGLNVQVTHQGGAALPVNWAHLYIG